MRSLILPIAAITLLFASVMPSAGQGQIKFGNDSTANDRIYDQNERPIIGVSAYRFGLYMGAAGSSAAQLVLVATAVNSPATSTTSPIAGVFNGGNPYTLPSPYAAGTTYAFQIRGWLYGDGASFEAAMATGDGVCGMSSVGFVTPALSPNPDPSLFGLGAGQVGGFTIGGLACPEPGPLGMGGLGVATLLFFRRRK